MLTRRSFLALSAALAASGAGRVVAAPRDDLREAARALAAQPYKEPDPKLPAPFDGLDYDAYRGIRVVPGKSSDLPLGDQAMVDLLPPGWYHNRAVAIEIVRDGEVDPVEFSPQLFDFDPRFFEDIPEDSPGAGFSGLRVRAPLNRAGVFDEYLVLQGASYFRAIGAGMTYGLSSRALAIGTGGPEPEEFPHYKRLRLRPLGDGGAVVEAVVDSKSTTIYMRMEARPGETTHTGIELSLFPRVALETAGIAPLTSMYLKGPLRSAAADDFRPAVHDSDALRIENGSGEVLWRPLSNPARIETSSFADRDPRAYALVQSHRDFADYQDAEAVYHRRPTARVVPRGDWGEGAVMLVELPTEDEFMDNVVAFWRPAEPLAPGEAHDFAYDIEWTDALEPAQPQAHVAQTRSGAQLDEHGVLRYVVDFDNAPEGLTPDLALDAEGVEVSGLHAYRLPANGWLRVSFLLTPGNAKSAELRLVLRDGDDEPASDIWLHRWTPSRDGSP